MIITIFMAFISEGNVLYVRLMPSSYIIIMNSGKLIASDALQSIMSEREKTKNVPVMIPA